MTDDRQPNNGARPAPTRRGGVPPRWSANGIRGEKIILYKQTEGQPEQQPRVQPVEKPRVQPAAQSSTTVAAKPAVRTATLNTTTGTRQLRRMTPQQMKSSRSQQDSSRNVEETPTVLIVGKGGSRQKTGVKPKKKAKKSHSLRNFLIVFAVLAVAAAAVWYFAFYKGGKTADDLLSYTEYEQIMDDDEAEELLAQLGIDEDDEVSPRFGTYTGEFDGKELELTLDYPDGDDDRVVATFTTTVDGENPKEGICCYCGNGIFAFYKNENRIGREPINYMRADNDGTAISILGGRKVIEMELDE